MPYELQPDGSFVWVDNQPDDSFINQLLPEAPDIIPRNTSILDSLDQEVHPLKEAKAEGFSSLAEKETVETAGDTSDEISLNWWREDNKYKDWLTEQGYDTENLPDWKGSKQYKDYISHKAQQASEFSGEIPEAIGSILKPVSEFLDKNPTIKGIVKPVGSIFKALGNLLDLPGNIIRGISTAVTGGEPEKIVDNIWQAFTHGVTAGTEGQYFSFMDGSLNSMVKDMKQGMTEEEYKEYIGSDKYRQSKRLYQTGGLLLDLVFDPMWLVGAGQSKVLQSFKSLKRQKILLGRDFLTEFKVSGNLKDVVKASRLRKDARRIFNAKSEEFLNFTKKDPEILELLEISPEAIRGIGKTTNAATKQKLLSELMEGAVDTYSFKISKDPSAFDAFGYKVKFHKPTMGKVLPKKGDVLFNLSPSLEPIARILIGKFGGARPQIRRALNNINLKMQEFTRTDIEFQQALHKFPVATKETQKIIKQTTGLEISIEKAEEILLDFIENTQLRKTIEGSTDGLIFKDEFKLVTDEITGIEYHKRKIGGFDGRKTNVQIAPHKVIDSELGPIGIDNLDVNDLSMKSFLSEQIETWLLPEHKLKEMIMAPYRRNKKITEALLHDPTYNITTLAEEWHKVSRKLNQETKATRIQLGSFMENQKLATDQINDMLEIMGYAGGTKAMIGIDTFSDIGTKKLKHWAYEYVPHEVTDDLLEHIRKINPTEIKPKGLDSLLVDAGRHNWMPHNFLDENFMRKFWGNEKADNLVLRLRENKLSSKEAYDLWHDTLEKLRQQVKNMKSNHVQTAKEAFAFMNNLKNAKLINRQSVYTMNQYSRNGLIYRGYRGNYFKTGQEVFLNKVKSTKDMISIIEETMDVIPLGKAEGWLAKSAEFVSDATGKTSKVRHDPPPLYLGKYKWEQGDGVFSGYYLPEIYNETAGAMNRGLLKIFEPPPVTQLDKVLMTPPMKALKHFNQWWKRNVTLRNPAFHMRNYFSNRVVMQGEGRSIWKPLFKDRISKDAENIWQYQDLHERLTKAAFSDNKSMFNKITKKIDNLKNQVVDMGVYGEMKVPEAMELFMKKNIQSNGLSKDILGAAYEITGESKESFSKLSKNLDQFKKTHPKLIESFNDWNVIFGTKDKASKLGSHVASYFETALGRNELFLHLLKEGGMDMEQASRRVNKVMVDYNSLSKGEEILKTYLLPFYTWESRMIGVMLEKAMTQPTIYTKVIQAQENLNKMLEVDARMMPLFESQTEGVPITFDLEKFFAGKPMKEIETKFVSAEGFLPQTVVNLFDTNGVKDLLDPIGASKNLVEGTFNYVAGKLSPLIKTVGETGANYSFFYKNKIERYPGQASKFMGIKMPRKVQNVLRSTLGSLKQLDDYMKVWIKNDYTGKPYYSGYQILFKGLVGLKPYDHDELRQVTFTIGKLRDKYRAATRDMVNKVGNPTAQKNHAVQSLALRYTIKQLEFYKEFMEEHKFMDEQQEEARQEKLNAKKNKEQEKQNKSLLKLFDKNRRY